MVDGRWHGDNVEIRLLQVLRVGGEKNVGGGQFRGGHFQRGVFAAREFRDSRGVDVEANAAGASTKRHRHRQAHIAKANHRYVSR
jgi:hypothetical protein